MSSALEARDLMIILATARLHFECYGYEKTRMTEIGADAGMSLGLILRYFDSKKSIAAVIVGECMDDVTAQVSEAAYRERASSAILRAALYSLVMAGIERRWARPKLFSLVARSVRELWPPAAVHQQDIGNLLVRIVSNGRTAGDFTSEGSPDFLCQKIMATLRPYIDPVLLLEQAKPAAADAIQTIDSIIAELRA